MTHHPHTYVLHITRSMHRRLLAVRKATGKPASHWVRAVLERALNEWEAGK
jgi:predicted DNA-binding protein